MRRRQLSDFLKRCRARLTPAQVGLPDTGRRRPPGLRREDVAELTEKSATFRRLWNSPEVMSRLAGVGRYPHLGGISFEHSSYVPQGSPTLRLVIYTPHDRQTAEKIAAWHARPAPEKHHWEIADGH